MVKELEKEQEAPNFALSEYFTTGAEFWWVNLSVTETASDIWIFKQKNLSE